MVYQHPHPLLHRRFKETYFVGAETFRLLRRLQQLPDGHRDRR